MTGCGVAVAAVPAVADDVNLTSAADSSLALLSSEDVEDAAREVPGVGQNLEDSVIAVDRFAQFACPALPVATYSCKSLPLSPYEHFFVVPMPCCTRKSVRLARLLLQVVCL